MSTPARGGRPGECQTALGAELSPADRFVVWFRDRNYYTYEIATGKTVCVSEKVPYPLWDTDDRHPAPSGNYGIAGWSEGDGALLVYDRHDIWSLDPAARKNRSASPLAMAENETCATDTATPTPNADA